MIDSAQKLNSICDVPGIRVGHEQNFTARTGCTVVLPDKEVIAGVDIRGSAPGTREVDTIMPTRLIQKIHGLLLTGGSAFGLGAANGVMRFLEDNGIGFDTGYAKVPIVPAAVIYDLGVGDSTIRPDVEMAYQACLAATNDNCLEGMIGAGTGATVGKILGQAYSMNGGIGTCSVTLENGIVVGALAVVNALGDIISSQTGETIAGARTPDGKSFLNSMEYLKKFNPQSFSPTNTTLVVVATNANFNKDEMTQIARMAHDGLARAINPAHTLYDGDIVFALSTGEQTGNLLQTGAIAAELVRESIIRSVTIANR
ncbi:P1 family peptidase [candidate division KSB1 bacterium]|nr:P1 family peptidase [candidate division KSB1 bacterium]